MMRTTPHAQNCRRMLAALLHNPNDGPADISTLSMKDRLFLIATCSSCMIEEVICATAGYNAEAALEGLEALRVSMVEHVREICENENREGDKWSRSSSL